MLQKMVGVVLHTLKYSDSSSIVDVYTREAGRASFIVKVKRSKKSGQTSLLFQPLAMVEFEADFRSTKNLHPIKEAKLWAPFTSLPYHPFKSAIAMFLAEFLYRALREQEPNEALFAYLHHSILWLDTCEEKSFANFHLVFLMRLSRFLGLYPNVDDYQPGAYFDMVNACFTGVPPTSGIYLQPAESATIVNLLRMNYENMHLFSMNRLQRNRCLTLINDYYRLHLPDFPVLKSIDVLKELFS